MSEDNSNPYLNDPDVQLFLKFKEGNPQAFEELMTKYYARILNFIYRYVSQRALAEDLTQEVFIKVYNNAHKYSPKSKLSTWIFTIAKNISINQLRRYKKTVSLDASVDTEDGTMQRQLEDPNAVAPGEAMVQEERVATIKAAIDDLPENQRMAVILRRYEKMSYLDIAKTMGTTEKAVKSLLNRAKENLRIKLAKLID